MSAWTQTERMATEPEEESGYGECALATWQEGSFPIPPTEKKRYGAHHDNLLIYDTTSSRSQIPRRSRDMPIPLCFKDDC